jgi:BirA family biotin operon repressor/biotin-[acetyl-CoA-carboxylase] ligase
VLLAIPYALVHLEVVPTTQDAARERFVVDPVLVVADRQASGRGRNGRPWETADRAVAASLAVRPEWPEDTWPRLGLVAGLAAAESLHTRARLKWPNDVVLDGRKIAGVLLETSGPVVVAGFGANLYWSQPIEGAGALYAEDPGPTEATRVAEHWAVAMLARIERGPSDWGHDEYLARCGTVGRRVRWRPAGEGVAIGIDPDGALVVEEGGEVRHLRSGEVHEVREQDV